MFNYLDLDFIEKTKNYIKTSTNAKNTDQYQRNARLNSKKWMNKISLEDKRRIYDITGEISALYYEKYV